jgi:hypothetical protein
VLAVEVGQEAVEGVKGACAVLDGMLDGGAAGPPQSTRIAEDALQVALGTERVADVAVLGEEDAVVGKLLGGVLGEERSSGVRLCGVYEGCDVFR